MNNYRVIHCPGTISSDQMEKLHGEGWELVTIIQETSGDYRHIFKRIKEQDAPEVRAGVNVIAVGLCGLTHDESMCNAGHNAGLRKWYGAAWQDNSGKWWRLPGKWMNRDVAITNVGEYADTLGVDIDEPTV